MYLKALEVNGFKSFAEKVRIDFTKGITSVVGPNGSGKSNILDSILWVLGEQSYKNIRAKESQDVIFSGGKNKKEKAFAEVSLIIDNSDFTLQHEATEIKVTRYINRKSDNFYFINDQKVRLKDIQELFLDTGVGKSAYSVIGQGKVERIVGSSSLEIRSIIEEAAGIKKVKLRKSEAVKIFLSHYLRYFSSNSLNDWRFLSLSARIRFSIPPISSNGHSTPKSGSLYIMPSSYSP